MTTSTTHYEVWGISPTSKKRTHKQIGVFELHQWQWAEKMKVRLIEEGYENVQLIVNEEEVWEDEDDEFEEEELEVISTE